MALSEKEKDWLERRKILCTHCDLISREICKGEKNKTSCQLWKDYHCNNPVKGYKAFQDMQDAAEFEARVVEKLLRRTCFNCPDSPDDCPTSFEHPRRTSKDCRLKRARLAAEAEMDRKS